MEFNEKFIALRKSKGLTQEEMAEILCVSRAAVAKWESGRGMPSIDSIKDISSYFSVSIDDLLSGDKILLLAEKENRSNIESLCDLLLGITDLLSVFLIVLPIYPNEINGVIYGVNLLNYTQVSKMNLRIYWIMLSAIIVAGILKLIFIKAGKNKYNKPIMEMSFVVNIIIVIFMALTRQVYSIIISFSILLVKTIILFKYIRLKI